jgi:hypothetical protein
LSGCNFWLCIAAAGEKCGLCITSGQALLCSMTKMLSQKVAVKYHYTGKSTIQAHTASISGMMKE